METRVDTVLRKLMFLSLEPFKLVITFLFLELSFSNKFLTLSYVCSKSERLHNKNECYGNDVKLYRIITDKSFHGKKILRFW